MWTWGSNFDGQLADGTTTGKNTPTGIACPTSVIGIKEIQNTINYFSIYPNPAANSVKLLNLENKHIERLTITDSFGRTLFEQSENTKEIKIEGLSCGIYQFMVLCEGKIYSCKFIKE